MFDRFDDDEKRRLLFGATLLVLGSVALGIGSVPDPGRFELLVYGGGAVVFGAFAVALAVDLYRG